MSLRGALIGVFLCFAARGVAQGQACTSVTLSSSAAFAASGSSNGTFTITGNPTNCAKSAVSSASWITISFGGGTANPSTIGYTVTANASPNQRIGTINVNGD